MRANFKFSSIQRKKTNSVNYSFLFLEKSQPFDDIKDKVIEEFDWFEEEKTRRLTVEGKHVEEKNEIMYPNLCFKRNSVHSEIPNNANASNDFPSRNKNKGIDHHKYTVGEQSSFRIA